jgi:hypothetical protein
MFQTLNTTGLCDVPLYHSLAPSLNRTQADAEGLKEKEGVEGRKVGMECPCSCMFHRMLSLGIELELGIGCLFMCTGSKSNKSIVKHTESHVYVLHCQVHRIKRIHIELTSTLNKT